MKTLARVFCAHILKIPIGETGRLLADDCYSEGKKNIGEGMNENHTCFGKILTTKVLCAHFNEEAGKQ